MSVRVPLNSELVETFCGREDASSLLEEDCTMHCEHTRCGTVPCQMLSRRLTGRTLSTI